MEPYSTMYDDEQKLFKMWVRAESDANKGYVGGNAAYVNTSTRMDPLSHVAAFTYRGCRTTKGLVMTRSRFNVAKAAPPV